MGKPFDCDKCGETHPRGCKKHVRRCECGSPTAHGLDACPKCYSDNINENSPCRNPARDELGACKKHGGGTQVARNAIARRETEAKAIKILGREGVDEVKHPVEELLDLVATAKTLQRILSERMDEATDTASSDYQAWERSLDRLSRLLIDLSRLGLENRKVALDQQRMEVASAGIRGAITEWTRTLKQRLPDQAQTIDAHLSTLPDLILRHLQQAQDTLG